MYRRILRRGALIAAFAIACCAPASTLAQPNSGVIYVYNFLTGAPSYDIWLTFADSTNWVRNAAGLSFLSSFTATFEQRGFRLRISPVGSQEELGAASFYVKQNVTSAIILHGDHTASVLRDQPWSEFLANPGLMIYAAGGNPGIVTLEDAAGSITTFPALNGGRSPMLKVAPGPARLSAGGKDYSVWMGSYSTWVFFVDGVWYGPSPTAPIVPLQPFDASQVAGGVRLVNTLATSHPFELRVDGAVVASSQIAAATATRSYGVRWGQRRVQLLVDGASMIDTSMVIPALTTFNLTLGRTSGRMHVTPTTSARTVTSGGRGQVRVMGTGPETDTLYAALVRSADERTTVTITSGTPVAYDLFSPGTVLVELGVEGGDMLTRSLVPVEAGVTRTLIPVFDSGAWSLRSIVDSDSLPQGLVAAAPARPDSALAIVQFVNLATAGASADITVGNISNALVDTTFTLPANSASRPFSGPSGAVEVRAAGIALDSIVQSAQLLPDHRSTFIISPSTTGPSLERFELYAPLSKPRVDSALVRTLSLINVDDRFTARLEWSNQSIEKWQRRGLQTSYSAVPTSRTFLSLYRFNETAMFQRLPFALPDGAVATIIAVGRDTNDMKFYMLREDGQTEGGVMTELALFASISDGRVSTGSYELRRDGERLMLRSIDGQSAEGITLHAYDATGRLRASSSNSTLELGGVARGWILVVVRDRAGGLIASWRVEN